MNTHNFIITNCDTDSISFCKQDQTKFSSDEISKLIDDLNSNFPEKIRFANDGYFPVFVVLKAKNYIMWDGTKLKFKGSALKDAKKEPALKEFQKAVIDSIIFEKNDYTEIYNKYIREAMNITDIKRWASKKTISKTAMESTRSNETRIMDALVGKDFSEGDKVYMFFREKEKLALVEDFDGTYDKDKVLEKLYKTVQVFKSVIDIEKYFPNYKLRKNKPLLNKIID